MKVHHINCGTMCPPFARLLHGRGSLFARGRMVCHCLVAETQSGLCLVDTGLGTADVESPRKRLGARFVRITRPVCSMEETALSHLKRLGLSPGDVRHITPTHLDLDHVGGLSDFPDAAVHILSAEQKAALHPNSTNERQRYRKIQFAHGVKWTLHDPQGERWLGFESVRPLAGTDDEILIVPLFGHTRGHAGIAVKTDAGWLLHAGDAYFAHDEIHATPPSCPPGLAFFQWFMQVDGEARLANQARLRELLREQGSSVRIICAHDAAEMDSAPSPERGGSRLHQ